GLNNDLGSSAYFNGKVNAYLVGVTVPMGDAGKLLASFQFVRPDNKAFPNNEDVQVYNLGYEYPLSRRTNLYALASFTDGAVYGFQTDSRKHQIGVGMRH